MPITIKNGFDKLKQNLEITDRQSTTVSTRQQSVREAIEDGMTVEDSFLAGSYARSTMVSPLKEGDVDIFMILDTYYYSEHTPSTLLEAVRKVLLKRYPTTPKINKNGQAVTITFTDFKVDVVPAFRRRGGGFLIPNSGSGNWISTDPQAHATHLTNHNKTHNGNLVPLTKMMRAWNRKNNRPFKGFYLELMTASILNNIRIDDMPSGARYVFDKGREKIKFKQTDPAGFGDQINPLENCKKVQEAVQHFTDAYNHAVAAEQYEAMNATELAYEEWQDVFGDYFPAYG